MKKIKNIKSVIENASQLLDTVVFGFTEVGITSSTLPQYLGHF